MPMPTFGVKWHQSHKLYSFALLSPFLTFRIHVCKTKKPPDVFIAAAEIAKHKQTEPICRVFLQREEKDKRLVADLQSQCSVMVEIRWAPPDGVCTSHKSNASCLEFPSEECTAQSTSVPPLSHITINVPLVLKTREIFFVGKLLYGPFQGKFWEGQDLFDP